MTSVFSNLAATVSTLVSKGASLTTSSFPYTIGEEIPEWKLCRDRNDNVFKMHYGKKRENGEKVTIFAMEKRKECTQNRVDAALNAINELKRIRHPHILRYIDGLITEDKIYIVSEEVYPLLACIENVANAHKMNESFIALGLYQISTALSFVHNDLKYVHCLVSPSSIFVNKAGDFLLGSFELAHKYKAVPSHFSSNWDLLPLKYKPKEYSKGDTINQIMQSPIHSIDSWCIGCLIFELFNSIQNDLSNNQHSAFTKPQQLSNLSAIPYNLQSFYKRLLATKPSSRLTLSSLLDSEFIEQNSLVQTSKFLSEIAIKSDKEKRQFLQHLDKNIESYPSSICKYKILPALSHLLQHGFGSNPVILSCVLKISNLFMEDDDEKQQQIRPLVVSMFKNNERGTRINLLKSFPKIITYLDTKTVSNDIWPLLQNGFTDSSPVLREASVRSVIHFTPKLNDTIISKQLLPLLDRLQENDSEPAIRTNLVIVLGKIAKYVNIKNNKENELLLVRCFGRALNDKFTPCRNASLMSFSASIGLFSPQIIASKILPYIMKYTCDPYKTVRDSAFKCIEIGIQRLKQHALTLADKPPVENNANNQSNSSQQQKSESSYLGGVSSWASRISGGYIADNTTNKDANTQNNSSKNEEHIQNENKAYQNQNQNVSVKPKTKKTLDDDDIDAIFAPSNVSKKKTIKKTHAKGMKLSSKKEDDMFDQNENNNKDMKSLDDFLASFTDDLNKQSEPPKAKVISKNRNKNKHKKKKKVKKEKKPTQDAAADDFFDDW